MGGNLNCGTKMNEQSMRDREFNEILRLSNLYRREASRCRNARAYLAGCVMLGGALEAVLVATAMSFWGEAKRARCVPKKSGKVRPVAGWDLGQLLGVARELRWLPAGLDRGQTWDVRRAKIGDYADALRQVRNLVHPGSYLRTQSPARVTKRYLEMYFEVLDVSVGWLQHKVVEDLRNRLDLEQARPKKQRTSRPAVPEAESPPDEAD